MIFQYICKNQVQIERILSEISQKIAFVLFLDMEF